PEEQAWTAPTAHIQATIDAVIQAWEQAQAQAKADQAIQASQLTDANPWLRMTRWADYLQGIQAHDLLACVAAPEEDAMDATEQQGQTPYQPLLAYMDEAMIQKHIHPWQQILAFIARTQAPHNQTSLKYGMTARQRQKWRQLWQLTSQAPGSPDPQGSWGSQAAVPGDLVDLEGWAMTTIEKACLEFYIKLLN
ncbi:hypothetical protein IFM61606_10444, partial [Aspergillus udagawae]